VADRELTGGRAAYAGRRDRDFDAGTKRARTISHDSSTGPPVPCTAGQGEKRPPAACRRGQQPQHRAPIVEGFMRARMESTEEPTR